MDPISDAIRLEGARYALLRRLAPSMRHHLVVNLQPIGMIYEVLDKRLLAAEPQLAQIKDSAARMNGFARAAVQSCLDVMTWLTPEEGATSTVAEGVQECMGLLNGNFNFRGFSIANEAGACTLTVSRPGIRSVLTACMLACTDERSRPADLVLRADAGNGEVALTIALADNMSTDCFPNDGAYRDITWADVGAIAAAESIGVSHDEQLVRITFPGIIPTVPLTVD
ncbi:MAG: hypothetical protein EOO28_30515 [Comamonadaceae bacterium]|nr:MAG: hypothetical protein EOO28_30515 [Comamonadaceae bacterium]